MGASTRSPNADRAERQWRLTRALVDEAVATSASLQAVLARLYRRDPDGLAHVNRVAQWSVRLGEELGVEGRMLDHLERAGWIHDLGKLILPDVEPGDPDLFGPHGTRLAGEQVMAVYQVTRSVPFLKPAGSLVRGLHECFDGSGYPDGLRGDAIALESRILHVANVYDVLTSVCLALAVSCDAVNAEIVRHAGSRFDPAVVAAWLRCSEGAPCSSSSAPSSS